MTEKKKKVRISELESTPTATTTTTSGQAITGVFGSDSEAMKLKIESEKSFLSKLCPKCNKYYSIFERKCPYCKDDSD
jgi:hypothetical protein